MSIKKKLIAGISALVMALSLTACADTTWANKVDGKTIKAGVYIYYTQQGYEDAREKLKTDSSVTEANIFTKEIDSKSVSQYIEDYASQKCREIVAVEKKFKELGLEISEAEEKAIRKNVDALWESSGKDYKASGISKDSIEKIYRNEFMLDKLFTKYYDKGGLEEVKDEDINKELAKQYSRVKFLPLSIKGTDGTTSLSDAEKAEVEKQANQYIERIKKG